MRPDPVHRGQHRRAGPVRDRRRQQDADQRPLQSRPRQRARPRVEYPEAPASAARCDRVCRRVPRPVTALALVRLHACGASGRSASRTRRRLRAGGIRDRRRADPEGLVRAFEKRRRCDRCSRASRIAEAGEDARTARLRRLALRPARRRQKPGRPERLRLEGLDRHESRCRLPSTPTGRRARPDRWNRPLRRSRDTSADRSRVGWSQRDRLRRCRSPLNPRGHHPARMAKLG